MDLLYRFCSGTEVKKFFENGFNRSLNCEYLSLTNDGETNGFDPTEEKYNYRVTYNADIVYQQGGIKVQYDVEFFEQNPVILEHVSGWKLDPPEYLELYINKQHLMHSVVERVSIEQETLVKFLTMEKALIVNVERFENNHWLIII